MAMRNVSGGKGSPGVAGGTYIRPVKKGIKAIVKNVTKKTLTPKLGANKTVKATTKKKVVSTKRQAFDGPVSRSSAKDVIPKMGKDNLQISKNVAIKNAKSPSGRVSIRGGAGQVMSQNVRASLKNVTKAEAKANARGLKAANKKTNKVGSKADKELRSRTKSVVMSKEETKANYDYYYGKGSGEGITQINKRVTPKNEARSVRKMPKKSK